VTDWDLNGVMVVVQMAIGCQEILTSKRATVTELLPRLEALDAPPRVEVLDAPPRETTAVEQGQGQRHIVITTSNVAKYTVGQAVRRGTVVGITPDTQGAAAGPGQLEVRP
jgi:hypothetical protein